VSARIRDLADPTLPTFSTRVETVAQGRPDGEDWFDLDSRYNQDAEWKWGPNPKARYEHMVKRMKSDPKRELFKWRGARLVKRITVEVVIAEFKP
jgi:hypothetical protein